jgi:hypothetical protein
MHVVMFVFSSAAMAPIFRSTDSPHVTPPDSHDPSSQESSLGHASDTLPLVLEQMALINARLDAQTADAAAAFAAIIADPLCRATLSRCAPRPSASRAVRGPPTTSTVHPCRICPSSPRTALSGGTAVSRAHLLWPPAPVRPVDCCARPLSLSWWTASSLS